MSTSKSSGLCGLRSVPRVAFGRQYAQRLSGEEGDDRPLLHELRREAAIPVRGHLDADRADVQYLLTAVSA
ncbi:hypothetical protein [Streptomyces sp. NPDC055085]